MLPAVRRLPATYLCMNDSGTGQARNAERLRREDSARVLLVLSAAYCFSYAAAETLPALFGPSLGALASISGLPEQTVWSLQRLWLNSALIEH
jgi:hypothetical protein